MTSDASVVSIRYVRTTIDIDPVVLRELKRRARARGTTLGGIVSELLAGVLKPGSPSAPPELEWRTQPMNALVDLRDKEALRRALDGGR